MSTEPRLDVAAALRGKRLLFVGATGFVGKVAFSMLLRRYPDVEKVFVLVRPGAGSSEEDGRFEAFLREKVVPLPGDVSRPLCNFTEADFARFGKLDAIVNCAGLV